MQSKGRGLSKIVLALLTLSTVSVVSAQDLYVTSNGAGEQCSKTEPCGSIQTAIDLAKIDDRIKIRSGTFRENITISAEKEGLMLVGAGKRRTIIESAGGVEGVEAPADISADIVVDIFAKNVTVKHMTVRHAQGQWLLGMRKGAVKAPVPFSLSVQRDPLSRS